MALFSNFCNICYKIDNGSLKDISEENMKHLNDILIILVGHADIIKFNVIYLCQMCCEELTRFDKFREMSLSNLIQLRQRYINMKLELEGDNACAVKNTLQKFVYEEVLRTSCLEKSNCPISIVTDCHEIVNNPADVNKDCLVFNRQVTDLQLETNECEFDGGCSVVSCINSVTQCDESGVTVTNEMLRCSENTRLEKFEEESDEDIHVSDANNDNKSDTSQIEIMKEEYDLKNERENTDSGNFTMKNYEIESDEHANLDVKVPVVYNSGGSISTGIVFMKEELNVKQENSASKGFDLQRIEDGFGDGLNVTFEIDNVCTIVNMEEPGLRNIRSVHAKARIKLRNRGPNNKTTASIINTHPSRVHVQEDSNECSTTLQSTASKRLQSGAKVNTCVAGNQLKTSSLVRHERIHSGDRLYKCTVCDKAFACSSNLINHERTHSGDKPYKCTVCNKAFARSSNLTTHKRIHSGDKPFKCTVCHKTFVNSSYLTRHKRTHSGDKPYKCSVCNKAFGQSSNLTTHKRIHSGEKPYECTVCNKAFADSSALTSHKRIHSDDKPYKCTVCNKALARSSDLTTHKRIHNGDKPYKCTVCNKAFSDSSALTSHKRIHSDDKPYKCTVCNKAFARSSDLTTHKRIHSGDKPYKCTVCNKAFSDSSTLTSHKRIHSGDKPYKCTVCNKAFARSSDFTTHKRIHSGDKPYKCTVCNSAFARSSDLTTHKRIHCGEKPLIKAYIVVTTHERIHMCM